MPKKRTVHPSAPIDWIDGATPEEIGETLLSVDAEKAVRVVIYLASVAGPEVRARLDGAVASFRARPEDVVLDTVIGGVRGLLGSPKPRRR